MNEFGKYEGTIERIEATDATFAKSAAREIEPTYINYFYLKFPANYSYVSCC